MIDATTPSRELHAWSALDWLDHHQSAPTKLGSLPAVVLEAFGIDRRWWSLFAGMADVSLSRRGCLRLLKGTLKTPAGLGNTVEAVFYPLPPFLRTQSRQGGMAFLANTEAERAWLPLGLMGEVGTPPTVFGPAIGTAVALHDGCVLYSSVDFQGVSARFDLEPHNWEVDATGKALAALMEELDKDWLGGRALSLRHSIRDLGEGISFGGAAKGTEDFMAMVAPLADEACDQLGVAKLGLAGLSLPVVGSLLKDQAGEVLNFGLYFPGKKGDGGKYVLIKGATADEDLSVQARSVGVSVRKSRPDSPLAFGFAADADLKAADACLRIRLRLEPGGIFDSKGRVLILEARALKTAKQKPRWLKTLLGKIANPGGQDQGQDPPGPVVMQMVGALGDLVPTLFSFDAVYRIPEKPVKVRPQIRFVLGYTSPWKPFDLFEIYPQLVVSTDLTASGTRYLVRGRLSFAMADFDLALDPHERFFSISLAEGTTIDLGGLFRETIDGTASAPTSKTAFAGLWVMSADFSGRLATDSASKGTLFLEIITGGGVTFHLGPQRTLGLGDICFMVERDALGEWTAELGGVLLLNNIAVAFAGRYSPERIHLECRIPRLNVGELVDFVMGDTSVCPELAEATLAGTHLGCAVTAEGSHFHFSAYSEAPVRVGKLNLTLVRLELKCGKSVTFDGALSLELGGTQIALELKYDAGSWTFKGGAQALNLNLAEVATEIAKAFDIKLFDGDPPSGLILDSLQVEIQLGAEKSSLSLGCGVLTGGGEKTRLAFGLGKDKTSDQWFVASMVAPPDFALPELPVVGGVLRQVGSIKMTDVTVGYATRDLAGDDIPKLGSAAPTRLPKGFSLHARIGLYDSKGATIEGWVHSLDLPGADAPPRTGPAGGQTVTGLAVKKQDEGKPGAEPAKKPQQLPAPPPGELLPQPADEPSVHWIDIGKKIGPLTLGRIGGGLDGGDLRLLADAGITAGPVRFQLIGLEARTKAMALLSATERKTLKWGLSGINVEGKGRKFGLGGALVTDQSGAGGYQGRLLLTCGQLTLAAEGIYTETPSGQASLAVLARLDYPLGGPPAFFVEGLAAGFGCNRELQQPTVIEDVPQHCLVSFIDGKSSMADLKKAAPPKAAAHWLALGVRFNSFLLLKSRTFVSVSFGGETVINVLGVSDLSLPPKLPNADKITPAGSEAAASPLPKALAKIRFALMAEIRPDDGEARVFGRILPGSYLFDEKAVLTGEFAFRCWFGPKNRLSGDFALTLGGYGPRFAAPAHYPQAAPFELNWQPRPELSVKGKCYFALTPTAVMAGGGLSVQWRSGAVHAWFECQADLIVYFQPFSYEVSTRVDIGVEATLDIGFLTIPFRESLSARLDLWGPPFDGVARVSFHGISFDVRLGMGSPPDNKAVPWDAFRKESLPSGSVFSLAVPGCALDGRNGRFTVRCVNPGSFEIELATAAPAVRAVLGAGPGKNGSKVGIRAMQKTSDEVDIVLEVTIAQGSVDTASSWVLTERRGRAASGIWDYQGKDEHGKTRPPSCQTLENVITGFSLKPQDGASNIGQASSEWENCGDPKRTPFSWIALRDPSPGAEAQDLSWLPAAVRETLSTKPRILNVVEETRPDRPSPKLEPAR